MTTVPRRPKIAFFLATSGHSGVDRAMNNLIPALSGRGYAIDLIRVRRHGPWIASQPPGLNIHETNTSHVYSSLFFLKRYLNRHQPAVLYSDKDRANRTAFFANKLSGSRTKTVVSLGTTVSINLTKRSFLERQLQKISIRYIYPLSDSFLVTSKGVADDVQKYIGKSFTNMHIVPRPVISKSIFQSTYEYPHHTWFRDKQKPLILGVGELSYRKDFSTLLQAFSLVREQLDCRLMILGRGNRRDELLALAEKLSVADNVSLPGFVRDPYPYMAHSNLIVSSSRWEGLGFVLIEALALGRPVVSTDCPSGPREILQDGTYGRLVPVGDQTRMARAIIETLQQPMSPSFLQQAAWPYEIERSTDAYLQAMGLPLSQDKNPSS